MTPATQSNARTLSISACCAAAAAVLVCGAMAGAGEAETQPASRPISERDRKILETRARREEAYARQVAERKARYEKIMAEQRAGKLCLAGTAIVSTAMQNIYAEFHKKRPDSPEELWYADGGTEIGLRELAAGHAEGVVAVCPLNVYENKQLALAFPDPARPPDEVVLGRLAMGVVVPKANPVAGITCQQLEDIYRRKITQWPQVGGPAGEILPYISGLHEKSHMVFTRVVMQGEALSIRIPPRGTETTVNAKEEEAYAREYLAAHANDPPRYLNGDWHVDKRVAKEPLSLGFRLVSPFAEEPEGLRFVPVAPRGQTAAVAPTKQAIALDKYPLQLTVKFLLRPDASPMVRDFVRFACTEEFAKTIRQASLHPAFGQPQTAPGS